MDEDLMPNDGTFFFPREPKDQVLARKAEKAKTLEVLPILKELLKQFERDIEFYGSIDSIPPEVKTDPGKFLIVHNANELTRNALMAKKEYIESLLDTHASNR